MQRLAIAVISLLMLAACGGGGSSSSTTPPPGGGGTGGNGSTPANPAVVVNVTAGQASSGVNISVSTPAASPAPNATMLGAAVVPPGGGNVTIDLSNTGTTVHRGDSIAIALIGDGLTGTMTVTISGPADITIDTTTIKGFTASNNKPGLSFQALVASDAALGARSVLLKNTESDITSFTGGLEVIP